MMDGALSKSGRVVMVLCCLFAVRARGAVPDGRYRLVLEKGVWLPSGDRPPLTSPSEQEGAEALDGAPGESADEAEDAAVGGGTQQTQLTVAFEKVAGRWQPVGAGLEPEGLSRPYGHVWGLVRSARAERDEDVLSVRMLVVPGSREFDLIRDVRRGAPGFTGEYEIHLACSEETLSGNWQAELHGESRKGTLSGTFAPRGNGKRDVPVPLGKHPRFLFRPEDLPELRARFATPWGRTMRARLEREGWSRSGMAVAQGLLYQLTRDDSHARRARELIQADIDSGWWTPLGPIHDPGQKACEASIAYDLIHDACDEGYHERMRRFVGPQLKRLESYCNIARGNGNHRSNWSGLYRGGMAMAALAMAADPVPVPEPVSLPDLPRVESSQGFTPDPNRVPVVSWNTRSLNGWLVAGPLNIGTTNDGLASLGGVAKARPVRDQEFSLRVKAAYQKQPNDGLQPIEYKNKRPRVQNRDFRGDDLAPLVKDATAVFRDVPKKWLTTGKEYWGAQAPPPGIINMWDASGRRSFQSFYFYAIVENDRPRHVQLLTGLRQQIDRCAWIAGQRIGNGEVFFLDRGRFPVMLPMQLTTFVFAHGREEWLGPRFVLDEVTDEELAHVNAHRSAIHTFRSEAHKVLRASSADGRAPDLHALMWAEMGRCSAEIYADQALGDRGWNQAGECYTRHPARVQLPYAHAYRNAVGLPPSSGTGLSWLVPLCAVKTVFSPDGARMHSYGRGGGPLGVDKYARGAGLTPKELVPGVYEAWRKTQALADAGKLKNPNLVIDELDPMSAAFMFVNGPLPDKPSAAAAATLPLVVHDRRRSSFVFRNAHRDADDIVLLLPGRTNCRGDWPDSETGCPRLLGLGAEWSVRGSGRSSMSVIWLADGANGGGPAPTLHFQSEEGRHSVTMDTTQQYLRRGGQGTAIRAVAADYSGAAGVPMLLAVVDRMTGFTGRYTVPKGAYDSVTAYPRKSHMTLAQGRHPMFDRMDIAAAIAERQRELQQAREISVDGLLDDDSGPALDLQLDDAAPRARQDPSLWQWVTAKENEVKTHERGFTITAPNGATLNATFLHPHAPKIHVGEESPWHEVNYHWDHQYACFPVKIIRAEGGCEFFVVMTLQHGKAPDVAVTGKGLAATATVGKSRVRFDDGMVVIE